MHRSICSSHCNDGLVTMLVVMVAAAVGRGELPLEQSSNLVGRGGDGSGEFGGHSGGFLGTNTEAVTEAVAARHCCSKMEIMKGKETGVAGQIGTLSFEVL
jgi:hypothetical protein